MRILITVIVDRRELRSDVPSVLRELGANIEVDSLEAADYVCGRAGIERKSAHDFLSSIVDKRVFEQAKYLVKAYPKAVIIVEGSLEKAIARRGIGPPQVYGALAALLDMGVSVLMSGNPRETGWMIYSIARRESVKDHKKYLSPVKVRVLKYNKSVANAQLNLIASIPGVSAELAHRILVHFGTPRRFFKASSSELRRVPGLGDKRVRRILEVLDTDYRSALLFSGIRQGSEDEKH
ncbi:MAG: hypothetical protein DRJ43_05485 [Thermoprotei archaeon]|nr:MAG: hypothetical protein DRJ43_05485 [Thermoprotei archaeon]